MAAALLFVSSPCPVVRTTCMHLRPTRSRIPPQGHGMGGEEERRLHFRHGPPPPQGRPYPSAAQAGLEGLGCLRRCVGERRIPYEPTGRPYPPAAQAGPEGLGCIRRCVGKGRIPCEPTGRPYPSAAQAGAEGLGCNRRCVGVGSSKQVGRQYRRPKLWGNSSWDST